MELPRGRRRVLKSALAVFRDETECIKRSVPGAGEEGDY